MNITEYSLLLIALYAIGLAFFTIRRKDNDNDYILGNRSIGFWHVYGSVISYMRAGSNLVFWFAFVSLMGFGSIWILIAFYIAFIFMTLLGERARKLSITHNYITFTDLIQNQQGPFMASWINIFSFYVILILVVSQLFVAGMVLSGLLQINIVLATLLCAITVGLYILVGGFISVVRTDFFQALSIICISLLALIFIDWPDANTIQTQLITPNWHMVLGFGIIGFAVPASTDMWQRFFAVKKEKIIVPATMLALLTDIIIVLGLILFIQYATGYAPLGNPDIFTNIFQNQNNFPLFTAIFGIFVISAVLSTMDNQIFNLASIASKNIIKIDHIKEQKQFVWILRVVSIISLLGFSLIALTISDLMQWIISTYAYVGVITPFIFYGVIKKAYSDKFLATGVLISSIAHWYMYSLGLYENMTWYAMSYSLSLFFVLLDAIFAHYQIKENS